MMRTRIFNKMTAKEVDEYLARGGDTIFLGIGVVECHGGLPNDVEAVVPEAYATLLAEKADGLSLINLPYFYPGGTLCSNATVHISIQDGIQYLTKICTSLVDQGFRRIYLVSGHGPSGLTIDAFCRDFFEKTLIHPCHIVSMSLKGMALGVKDMGEMFKPEMREKMPYLMYGAYKVMNQVEDLPIVPDAPQEEAFRKAPEPEMANFAKLLSPYGGRVSQIYSDPDEHGGGHLFKNAEERAAICEEGERQLRETVDKSNICELNEALAVYQEYARKVAAGIPRLKKYL